MSETPTPAWLQRQNDAFMAAQVAKQERELAEITIKTGGSQYWSDLMSELKTVAAHVPPSLIGKFQHSNFAVSRHEDHCRLEIAFLGIPYRASYADLWYRIDDKKIRCRKPLTNDEFALQLCVVEGRVCAVTEGHIEPMDAEAAAELLAEPMIQHAMNGAIVSA